MKGNLITAFFVLGCSMFCGIIIIAAGLGSFFPAMDQIAGPFVCGNQQLVVDQHTHSYKPGSTNFNITANCVDNQSGQKQDVTGPVQLVSGVLYGLLLFGIAIAAMVWSAFKVKNPSPNSGTTVSETVSPKRPTAANRELSANAEEKLRKLKELHDANLITDEDYEKKKAQILEDL